MKTYDTAQICLNGHVITSQVSKGEVKDYCPKCGAESITKCRNCGTNIKGAVRATGFNPSMDLLALDYGKPSFCEKCGNPYPWTERGQQAAYELIEFSELSDEEKKDFKNSIAELSKDSPKTPLEIAKFKKYAKKAGIEVGNGLKTIMVDLVSEIVKKAILP